MIQIWKMWQLFTAHPLTQKKPIIAFVRFIKWQISKRFFYSKLKFNWVNSLKINTESNDTAFALCYYTGLSEFEDQVFLLHFLRENDIFIDVGANSGVYSILASGVAKANSIAIEPIPDTFVLLEKNIHNTSLSKKVTLLNYGVSSKNGALNFTKAFGAGNHVVKGTNNAQKEIINIRVSTLDSILLDFNFSNSAIIKIDVEGFELEVLNGALNALSNLSLKAVIIEINPPAMASFGYDFNEINNIFHNYDFNLYMYEPFEKNLYSATLNDILSKSNNGIYIRDLEFVEQRLKSAIKYNILGYNI